MGAAEKQKYLNRAEGRSENRGGVQSIIAGLMYYEIGFASNSAKISGLITNQPGKGGGPFPPVPPALSY